MKIIIFTSLLALNCFAGTLSGTVESQLKNPEGTLYIFAKKFGGKMPMPLAVKKIENPKFPVKFSLSKDNAMMKGIPFKGPFEVTARLSPSGGVMDKSGAEAKTKEAIKIGTKNIVLTLKD